MYLTIPSESFSTSFPSNIFSSPADDDTQARTQSLIGIAVAIGGNVLISLALNCQKLAHKRLGLQKQQECTNDNNITREQCTDGGVETDDLGLADADATVDVGDELRPLIPGRDRRDSYTTPSKGQSRSRSRSELIISRDTAPPWQGSGLARSPITAVEDFQAVSIDIAGEEHGREEIGKRNHVETIQEEDEQDNVKDKNETDYLRSKLWWFGFLLMNVGEFGNFLSYAYAPASVVAPLGTVALIANCLFAPLMLKEKLRKRDLVGVVLAIFGAVTIVGAGKSSDVRLDPAGLLRAITQRPFIIYAIVCTVLIVVFVVLSEGPAGNKYPFVDVLLCALFGGFTVLSTKAISTLLSLHWIDIFKDRITYPVVAILAITGIGQIKYLNRALMKFDSKVVIPTFFVSFNLSAIVGSAILYGDFKDVEVHQFTTFLYGCATTFVGVFFLTRSTGQTGAALEDEVVHPEGGEDDNGNVQPNSAGTRAVTLSPVQSRGMPVLRTQKSSASLVLSPGQYLLLAASPPRERPGSVERPAILRHNSGNAESTGSISRRRTIAWDGR